jgi:hypothetical protein
MYYNATVLANVRHLNIDTSGAKCNLKIAEIR